MTKPREDSWLDQLQHMLEEHKADYVQYEREAQEQGRGGIAYVIKIHRWATVRLMGELEKYRRPW